jgi:chemotaxis signal transduction protein
VSAESKAAELRSRFDSAFALPRQAAAEDFEDFLQVSVGSERYALRLSELAGLVARRPITPVPSRAPGLLGVAGIRGEIVPVFGLASLLGGADDRSPPWLVLSAAPHSIALGFSAFDGFSRLARSELHRGTAAGPYSNSFISTAEGARAVIAVPLLVATLRNRLSTAAPKEQ